MKDEEKQEMLRLLREQHKVNENREYDSKMFKRWGAGGMIGAFWVAVLAPVLQGSVESSGIQFIQGACVVVFVICLGIYIAGYLKGDY